MSPEDLVELHRAAVELERTKPGAKPNDVRAHHEEALLTVYQHGFADGADEEARAIEAEDISDTAGLRAEARTERPWTTDGTPRRPAPAAGTNTQDSAPGPTAPPLASPSDRSG